MKMEQFSQHGSIWQTFYFIIFNIEKHLNDSCNQNLLTANRRIYSLPGKSGSPTSSPIMGNGTGAGGELKYLGVKHLFFVSNGTIALQIAIKALDLKGEVITTPFSYVATTSSLVWEGCQPVFVDIDPHTICIDSNLIEAAITEKTTGILTTHVYGIPCDVERIQAIAKIMD